MTTNEFISKIGSFAMVDQKKTGILASLTIAQAILESNWGKSGLTTSANNLFGIKGAYKGQSITMPTTEYRNGIKKTENATFRKYPSWAESLEDHSSLFLRLDRYKNLRGETDYKTACKNVQSDGYATDPAYASKLIGLIEKYNLTKYNYVKEYPALKQAAHKLAKNMTISNPELWESVEVINLKNVPALLQKMGGVDRLAKDKIISDTLLWTSGTYKPEHVRSLIIKYANMA
jgi:uncharacterized FlgJ-related protein